MKTPRLEYVQLNQSVHDALVIVDVQNDFLPGGALAVPHGDEVIPILNHYIDRFYGQSLPIFATRDWHPINHCSFKEYDGPWPSHCVADSYGAAFASELKLPDAAEVIAKATTPNEDAYSGFEGTDLANRLHHLNIHRVFAGGLATDYCVLHTVLDALREGYTVYVLMDAVRAVNVNPEDGNRALAQMEQKGANLITLGALVSE